jgi:hypothetical protein
MLRKSYFERNVAMHPDLTIELARLRIVELHADAARRPARRQPRVSLRSRFGRRLVRWGHRLAPATPFTGASPTTRRPATMGP